MFGVEFYIQIQQTISYYNNRKIVFASVLWCFVVFRKSHGLNVERLVVWKTFSYTKVNCQLLCAFNVLNSNVIYKMNLMMLKEIRKKRKKTNPEPHH